MESTPKMCYNPLYHESSFCFVYVSWAQSDGLSDDDDDDDDNGLVDGSAGASGGKGSGGDADDFRK